MDLIKKSTILGNPKIVIGDGSTDMVLNTLGKVYISLGNKYILLNDIFKLLENINNNSIEDIKLSVIISEDPDSLEYPGDGILVFNPQTKQLFISYLEEFILLFENKTVNTDSTSDDTNTAYVKRKGDTMTGPLFINTPNTPLKVSNKRLALNLNAEYLNGYNSNEVAVKKRDEIIKGSWHFEKDTTFEENINVENSVIVGNSISSPNYSEGYNGYGWKLDGTNNMLTVDYLVVRKTMLVFELLVNEINATNGSIWVTDATKITEVVPVFILDDITKALPQVWYVLTDSINACSVAKKHLAPSKLDKNLRDELVTFYNIGYLVFFQELPENLNSFNPNNYFRSEAKESTVDNVRIIPMFPKHMSGTCSDNDITNDIYNLDKTPRFYSSNLELTFKDKSDINEIYSYFKYFGISQNKLEDNSIEYLDISNLKVVTLDSESYPTIKEGDIIRCQKFIDGCIKYYDALVVGRIGNDSYDFIVLKAPGIFDKYSNDDGEEMINEKPFSKTNQTNDPKETFENSLIAWQSDPNILLANIEPSDEVVCIGSITNKDRRGSVYITSSEHNSPYIKIIDDVNKPDYTVNYTQPKFKKVVYLNKEYYCKLEKEDTTKPNCHLIGEEWYSLFDEPSLVCDIVTIENEAGEKQYCSEYLNHVKVQLGRLDGIRDNILKKKQPHGYGLYSQNVYLTGEFYLNNGQSVVDFTKNEITIAKGHIENILDSIKGTLITTLGGPISKIDPKLKETTLVYWKWIYDNKVEYKNLLYESYMFEKERLLNLELDLILLIFNLVNFYLSQTCFDLIEDLDNTSVQYTPEDFPPKYDLGVIPTTKLLSRSYILQRYYNVYQNWILYILDLKSSAKEPFKTTFTEKLYKTIIKHCERFYNLCNQYILDCLKKQSDITHALDSAGINIYVDPETNTNYLALWGPSIAFYTTKEELETGPKVFIKNGCLNSDLIDVNILKFNKLIGTDLDNLKVLTINELSLGESILYWPNGNIMNCKIIKKSGNIITGCVEYFFSSSGGISVDDIIQGDAYILLNFSYPAILKRIDYFRDDTNIAFKTQTYLNGSNNGTSIKSNYKVLSDYSAILASIPFTLTETMSSIINAYIIINNRAYSDSLGGATTKEGIITPHLPTAFENAYRSLTISAVSLSSSNFYYECNGRNVNLHCITKDGETIKRNLNDYLYKRDCTDIFIDRIQDPVASESNEGIFQSVALEDGVYVISYNMKKLDSEFNSSNVDAHATFVFVHNHKLVRTLTYVIKNGVYNGSGTLPLYKS